MRPEPFPDLGVIQLIHFRCLAVSRAKSVLCYRTLPLIYVSPCALINQRGGAQQEGWQEGRGAVLRTSPCTSYYHQYNQRGADCAAGGGAGLVVCYVYHVHYHQQYRIKLSAGSTRETQEAGGVLLCSSVLRSYVNIIINMRLPAYQ